MCDRVTVEDWCRDDVRNVGYIGYDGRHFSDAGRASAGQLEGPRRINNVA